MNKDLSYTLCNAMYQRSCPYIGIRENIEILHSKDKLIQRYFVVQNLVKELQ